MLHYLMTALSVACLSLAVAAAGLHEPSADYIVRFSIEARWTEPGLKEQPTRTNNSPGNLGLQVETSKVFQCHFVPFLLGSAAGRTDEVFVTLILFAWLGPSFDSLGRRRQRAREPVRQGRLPLCHCRRAGRLKLLEFSETGPPSARLTVAVNTL